MTPCHTTPFVQPGRIIEPAPANRPSGACDSCDYCGSTQLEWRKCKLVCDDCKQINKSCADL